MTYRVEVRIYKGWVKSRFKNLSEAEARQIAKDLLEGGRYLNTRVVAE